MNSNYWLQKATPWVSFSVLFGGLVSSLILFFLARVERQAQDLFITSQEIFPTHLSASGWDDSSGVE